MYFYDKFMITFDEKLDEEHPQYVIFQDPDLVEKQRHCGTVP